MEIWKTLKGYEGYVMRMLRDMETFREHFEVFRNETELKSTTWIDKNESFKHKKVSKRR